MCDLIHAAAPFIVGQDCVLSVRHRNTKICNKSCFEISIFAAEGSWLHNFIRIFRFCINLTFSVAEKHFLKNEMQPESKKEQK